MMRGLLAFFLFCDIITHALQYPSDTPSYTTVPLNAVNKALWTLGLTGSTVRWKEAFIQLAERHERVIELKDLELSKKDLELSKKDLELSKKDLERSHAIQLKDIELSQKDIELSRKDGALLDNEMVMRELNVLNFMCTHMEKFSLQLDPLSYTMKDSPSNLVTITKNDIPYVDIPPCFLERLSEDFRQAYVRWYRILMNSRDPRVIKLVETLKSIPLEGNHTLNEQDIAKGLAYIWCSNCNDIHLKLGSVKKPVLWRNEDDVADAFAKYEPDIFYINLVRVFFKETKFRHHMRVNK